MLPRQRPKPLIMLMTSVEKAETSAFLSLRIENCIEVFSVTHLYTYAVAFLNDGMTQFLRAQRLENGERTFKVVPGEPLQTAFGEDLYHNIFD